MVRWSGDGGWEIERVGEIKSKTQARKHESGEAVRKSESESEEGRWRKCGWRGKTKRMGSVGGCSLTKWGWIVSMTVGWWGSFASISEMRSKSTPSQAVHSKSSRWTSAHQPFSLSLSGSHLCYILTEPTSKHTDLWKLMINWCKKM